MKYLLLLFPLVCHGVAYDNGVMEWPRNLTRSVPDLSGGANEINDLNIRMDECGLFISTAGNYHMALGEYMESYLEEHEIENVVWTTSKPISLELMKMGRLVLGNVLIDCHPSVAIGPKKIIEELQRAGYTKGKPIAFMKNQGNVILVRKGNTRIRNIWDMRDIATSREDEPGSYSNYYNSIYNMAKAQKGTLKARELVKKIYSKSCSWGPIMHRGVPQLILDGTCESGLMFYHLALYVTRQYPEDFDFIPLGGTKEHPDPIEGNKVATLYIVALEESEEVDDLIEGYLSEDFTEILNKHGILRP